MTRGAIHSNIIRLKLFVEANLLVLQGLHTKDYIIYAKVNVDTIFLNKVFKNQLFVCKYPFKYGTKTLPSYVQNYRQFFD